jgi:hypothetical protein
VRYRRIVNVGGVGLGLIKDWTWIGYLFVDAEPMVGCTVILDSLRHFASLVGSWDIGRGRAKLEMKLDLNIGCCIYFSPTSLCYMYLLNL